MSKTYEFCKGSLPILVSMPHNGTLIPDKIAKNMTTSALEVVDTDWFMDRIYGFAQDMGCSLLKPLFSRYVIDLNRPQDNKSLYPGADTTELCPTTQFDRQPIYLEGRQPSENEIKSRVDEFWKPYHLKLKEELDEMVNQFGYALLFEAHSIKSVVPRFFEGQLPDFNFGNFDQKSSSKDFTKLVDDWQPEGYSKVFNARFKGGYITRHYGKPENGIDSLQLELSQATYLNEDKLNYDEEKAALVVVQIKSFFEQLKKHTLKQIKRR
ncbi:N-formylglutamate deformylase [Aliikangiella coralliicola]|uniref:N-formylglutamate deformylase n=1 Tax=Aliikangiella coralliicola TaxID=2592383 RepID=A0A545TZX5_9GAMM|nr:N-formylglutamate deformylase [Aliikangiella coralliicola]TQV82764.1 N-formylglutamate deformylase [Aliikangiella coralliicola]